MLKKRLVWVVMSAAFAFTGIVLTQTYWVVNAIRYQNEQFANQVNVALKSVVNRLYDTQGITDLRPTSFCSDSSAEASSVFYNPALAKVLDSLLTLEMAECGLPQEYDYLVFSEDKSHLFGRVKSDTSGVLASGFVVPVTCIHREGGILLAVRFQGLNERIFGRLKGWILLSVLFILMMLMAFYYVLQMYFSQRQLAELKADFISNMTHELKTPIATISLSSEMLLKPEVYEHPEKVKKYAALIFSENDRLKRQVEDVLQVTVFEQGRLTLKKEVINIESLLANLQEIFQVYAEEKGGKLITRKLCSAETLFADPQHFTNLLSNLIDNAIKYSGEKCMVRLEVKNYKLHEKEGLLFIVEDNGPGIPFRFQGKIFEKFSRIPTGDRHDVKGHGLGLYYVKTIAEAHGFEVWFKSHDKRGTSFYVFVPLERQKME
ncbi:MAG: HAMP domain-containing histidine kinase [Bacteroidales bacterium]|jgi:two-component system phosphate regulon sensor histidine kinase PhoR|nr:HAMP domain-containing histidine kinase [Bacteroidales bacterium]NPV35797.1 HAMP domain-containing histidine kinase [Bacteroidales bacterium]